MIATAVSSFSGATETDLVGRSAAGIALSVMAGVGFLAPALYRHGMTIINAAALWQ